MEMMAHTIVEIMWEQIVKSGNLGGKIIVEMKISGYKLWKLGSKINE